MSTVKVSVRASAQDLNLDTKTYIGTYEGQDNTIIWGKGEQMKIALIAETAQIVSSASTDEFYGENEAYFEFEIIPEEEADSYTYGGMYPASAAVSSGKDKADSYKVELPATQNASATSYDPAAYIMIAKPETFDDFQTDWVASFRRATALNKITLAGITEDIVSVEITVPEGIGLNGRRYFDLTTGQSGDVYYNKSNSVKVNYASALTGASKVVWFTSWESIIPAGGTITIKATSSAHTYTRTITARESGIAFHEGNLNLLSVNMAADDVVVEDLNSLAGNYIIVSRHINNDNPSGYWVYMSGTSTTFYSCENTTLSATEAIDITSSSISFSAVSDYWIVEKNGNNYSIKNFATGKFVGYANDDSNSASALDDAYALSISPDANTPGIFEIGSVDRSNRVLRYNGSSPRFAFYKGTQNKIYLIPYVQAQQYTVSISTNIANGSVTANKEMACAGETVTLTATPADNYRLQAWDVKDADNNTITVTDNSFIMPAKAVTVSATFVEKTYYNITVGAITNGTVAPSKTRAEAGETITVTVEPEEGYKLATLTYNGVDIAADKSFVMPAENVTIAATFEVKTEVETLTTTLTNANIVAGTGGTSYGDCSATDANGFIYNAYAIKNVHSKATNSYYYWQIKKDTNTHPNIQLPTFPGAIKSITLTVSSSSKPMTEGGNAATLYFSNSNSTAAEGTGVASGTGASSVTINADDLNLKSGYITASGAVRIWEITVEYYSE